MVHAERCERGSPATFPDDPEFHRGFGLWPEQRLGFFLEVRHEDIGTLSIEYRDGQSVVVVSGGKYIPSELPVVNNSGVAYAARFARSNGVAHLHTPDPAPNPAPDRLPGRQEGGIMSTEHSVVRLPN